MKYNFEIQSRYLYCSRDEKQVAELFEMTGLCEYSDDADLTNDFDIVMKSDLYRFNTSVALDESEDAQSDQCDAAITGTRTSAKVFTRTSGTWTVDALKAYRVWIYNSASPDAGKWHDILSNTANAITVESTSDDLVSGANRCQLQARYKIRHLVQLIVQPDFYGTFFQYKVTKKIPTTDGNFKWFGVKGSAIPVNVDPEFFATTSAVSNGW